MQLFIDYSTEQSNKYFKSYLTLSKYLIIRYFLIFLYILNIKIMLAKFRALASIQRFNNSLLEKSKFAFCVKRDNTVLNHQILACQNAAQLQKIFNTNYKQMDAINLITMLKKNMSPKLYKDKMAQNKFLTKSILIQIQGCWDQFFSDHQDNQSIIQLLMILSSNKIYDFNQKIMKSDFLQFFNNANVKQKGILLVLIIQLNLQKQFDQKYAGVKGQILSNAEYIRKNRIEAKDLIDQNIINILLYSTHFMYAQQLVLLWQKIIAKQLDTKFFNKYMTYSLFKSLQIQKKGNQLGLRYYIHLLKQIKAKRHNFQKKDIQRIIKNYPKNGQDVGQIQIYHFYSLTTYFLQLKNFIQYQFKLLNKKKLNKGKQSHSQDISQKYNQSSLLNLMQNKAIQKIKNMNLEVLNKMVYYLHNLDKFYSHPQQLIRQVQQTAIKIIRKQDAKHNNQQLAPFLINMANFYKTKNFSQIQYFYKQIVQYIIQKNLDQLQSDNLTALLSFLAQCKQIQLDGPRNLVQKHIFGLKDQIILKIASTLKNPNRIINLEQLLKTIKCLIKIWIANTDLCESIKNKIQTFQKTQQRQQFLSKIKAIKRKQSQYLCGLALKNCPCKSGRSFGKETRLN